MKIIKLNIAKLIMLFFSLILSYSCFDKVKNKNYISEDISSKERIDTIIDFKIEFDNFYLLVKSDEEPYSVEYKKLVGHNDYDGDIYEKRDTILLNKYGDSDYDEPYLYGNDVKLLNKRKVNGLKVKTTFNYITNVTFIDNVPTHEILDYSFTTELLIKDNTFSVIDKIRNDNLNNWFKENKKEIKTTAHKYIREFIENNEKKYQECCPEYIEDFDKFKSKSLENMTYNDLGVTTYLSSILLEISGEDDKGRRFTEYILD